MAAMYRPFFLPSVFVMYPGGKSGVVEGVVQNITEEARIVDLRRRSYSLWFGVRIWNLGTGREEFEVWGGLKVGKEDDCGVSGL